VQLFNCRGPPPTPTVTQRWCCVTANCAAGGSGRQRIDLHPPKVLRRGPPEQAAQCCLAHGCLRANLPTMRVFDTVVMGTPVSKPTTNALLVARPPVVEPGQECQIDNLTSCIAVAGAGHRHRPQALRSARCQKQSASRMLRHRRTGHWTVVKSV